MSYLWEINMVINLGPAVDVSVYPKNTPLEIHYLFISVTSYTFWVLLITDEALHNIAVGKKLTKATRLKLSLKSSIWFQSPFKGV